MVLSAIVYHLESVFAGVVPDMSPTASSSSHMFPLCSESTYDQTFSMLQASFLNPNPPASSCLNPYFASYDQELLPCPFSKRGFSGQDQRTPSQFIPTGSNAVSAMPLVPTRQVQQDASKGSTASYSVPKDVLHVGDDKPMAREARVARCAHCLQPGCHQASTLTSSAADTLHSSEAPVAQSINTKDSACILEAVEQLSKTGVTLSASGIA